MTPLVRRFAAPLSLAVAAGLLVAGPALAAPTWTPVVEIVNAANTYPDLIRVGVGDNGNATAVWTSEVDETPDASLVTASRPSGGGWSAPVTLSAMPLDDVDQSFDLAVAADGQAVAVWIEKTDTANRVRAERRSAAGVWTAPFTISADDSSSRSLSVAIDDAGAAVAVWDTATDTESYVDSATMLADGSWRSEPLGDGENPDVAMVDDGRTTVVWLGDDAGTRVIGASSRAAANVPFGGPEVVSPVSNLDSRPSVGMSAGGSTTVAWVEDAAVDEQNFLRASTKPAGGGWSGPVQVSSEPDLLATRDSVGSYEVVVDDAGVATIVWKHRVDDTFTVESASSSGGPWSSVATLGGSSESDDPDLAVDAAGNVAVAWTDNTAAGAVLARRPTQGGWGSPVDLDDRSGKESFGAAADTAAGGDIVAVWSGYSFGSDNGLLSARSYDIDGPLVSALSIPASGTAGTPLVFSVTAVDAWSPVTSTSWSFGDGTTASGASVSHTYASAGTYSVAVTVTDAVGNARTRTGTTVVAAAPVVTPPVVTPKPTLTGVKLTEKTIHVKGSDESPRATKLKLKLNTDAKVKVVLKRTQKVDGKTIKATVDKALKKGAATIKLTSKIGDKSLPPGTYKVKVTAKNSVGTSAATTVKLTILK